MGPATKGLILMNALLLFAIIEIFKIFPTLFMKPFSLYTLQAHFLVSPQSRAVNVKMLEYQQWLSRPGRKEKMALGTRIKRLL